MSSRVVLTEFYCRGRNRLDRRCRRGEKGIGRRLRRADNCTHWEFYLDSPPSKKTYTVEDRELLLEVYKKLLWNRMVPKIPESSSEHNHDPRASVRNYRRD